MCVRVGGDDVAMVSREAEMVASTDDRRYGSPRKEILDIDMHDVCSYVVFMLPV